MNAQLASVGLPPCSLWRARTPPASPYGVMTAASAEATAQVVTASSGAAIAAVASSVMVSSVAGAVSGATASAAGGAGGAAAGGAGMGGAVGGAGGSGGAGLSGTSGAAAGLGALFALVDQVQFMAVCGRLGGDNASQPSRKFSSGIDWINLTPPFDIISVDTKENRREGTDTETSDSPYACQQVQGCSLCAGKVYLEKLIVCFGIMAIIYTVRSFCRWLSFRNFPGE